MQKFVATYKRIVKSPLSFLLILYLVIRVGVEIIPKIVSYLHADSIFSFATVAVFLLTFLISAVVSAFAVGVAALIISRFHDDLSIPNKVGGK